MESKSWYKSKTLWANIVALVGGIGLFVQSGDVNALIVPGLAMLNIVLRVISKQPIGD